MLKRAIFLLSLVCAGTFGQSTSSLRGTIKDKSGAAIADSIVTLTDASTGTSRKVLADTSGIYQIAQVPPGKYTLRVEKSGFATLTKTEVTLEVNVPATVDCVLEIGSVETTINVEATATQINTVDATVGNAFQEKQVQELPLQTRNVVELLSIQPGVTQTGEVLGARRDQNNVTLDGVDVNNNQTSGITNALINGSQQGSTGNTPGFNAALPVPLDSVEEFRVTVAGQTADAGRSSGGQVTLVTRSGSNTIHGTLYEYNRNTLLAANDFFNNQAGIPRSPLVRNQFGASLGGPIKKDRLFLFANWERRIDASSTPETASVPSATLRQGILQAALSNGTVQTLTPADVKAIDPLNIGFNQAMKNYMSSLPLGNDPSLGLDQNLNFDGLRFNAPLDLDQTAYVAKLDYNIDQSGKHKLSIRGTLNGASQDLTAAALPGGSPAQVLLDNSKGLAANYTWIIAPNLINSARYGITRLGLNESGTLGTALSFQAITSPQDFRVRPSIQIMPTSTVGDDLTWIKGKHTITTGANLRFIRNTHTNFINSFPAYSFTRNTLGGLGGDATTDVTNYVNQLLGTSGLKLTQATAVQDGLGDLLGLLNQYGATYQYTKSGSVLPFGTPATREYAVNDYEAYVMDSWRVKRNLTITAGVRYSNASTPWEVNGTEVVTTIPLQQYFAERVAAMNAGIPNNQIKDAALTYTLGGSANGKSGWYNRANLNFGPRASIAYAPDDTDNWFKKLLGKGSVIRGGYALLYDQYGADMIFNIDQSGSPGLASTVTQPVNTDFTTSARYGGTLPALPAAAPGGFPFTPPTITGGFDEGVGVVSNLKAPYSSVLNLNYTRPLPSKMILEVGYAGRFYRRGLVQQDFDQPLTNFLDTKSNTTWAQAVAVLHQDFLSAGQNYGPVAPVPFIENMFPGAKNAFVPGSATQNYYYGWAVINGLSDEDNLNLMDRQRISGTNKCYTVTGCNTFYPLQAAGLPTWTNAAYSDFNAMTVTLRRALANGFSFDFNYTWSHSIDNSSGAEAGAGTSGAVLQDAFNVNAFRGSSDFDQRHNITADALYELPFGRNRTFARNANKFVDAIIGGWQVSTIFRYHSGLPSTISAGGVYPTNYEISALVNLLPGATNQFGRFIDNNGVPSLFANTSAANNYFQQSGGSTGTRAIIRLPGVTNIDISLMKTFALPWEGHKLSLRGEAFNAFNNVNLYNPILDVYNTGQFGEFQNALPARVMQLSMRYTF
ncbi:MAG TPA: carboxypeptidase-like regulatory domain-containing protein [Bryobacteraceae bacterium]|nr:carboxypeptidase-like regulatory domain-containing protein [Bryobacteraceae bacterium]